jgi:hypothetical protein
VTNPANPLQVTLVVPERFAPQFPDNLFANLNLYDPSGNLVATDSGTQETSLNYKPTVTGEYRLQVMGGINTSGEYIITQNFIPAISSVSATTIDEGGTTTLSGTFTDPGLPDGHTVQILWGDPAGSQTFLSLDPGVFSFSATHQYLDNPAGQPHGGSFSILVNLFDHRDGDVMVRTPVVVNNVAPSNVVLTPSPAVINENDTTTVSGSFTDPGTPDTHTVDLSWGDGSADTILSLGAGVLTFSASHQYLDNPAGQPLSSFTVTAVVTDKDGDSGSGSTSVTVNNVAPSNVVLTPSPATINENDTTTVSGSFADPGTLDTHTVDLNWGDGSADTVLNLAAGVLTFSASHQYLDNPAGQAHGGSFAVTAVVTDKDGDSGSGSTSVVVNNLAPADVTLSPSPAIITENDSTTVSGSFTDPGTQDTHTVDIAWGDGSADTILNLGAGVLTFSASHQYPDNPAGQPHGGTFAVTAVATDKDGDSGSGGTSVVVNNVAPSNVTLTPIPSTINENDSTTVSGSFTDPGTQDSHTVDIGWGDRSPDTILNLGAGVLTFSASHQYLDNPAGQAHGGSFTVTATVADKDGDSGSGGTSVVVNNVAPANVVLTPGPAVINENDTTTVSGSFFDPGTLDTHTVDLNWGDGSADTILNLGAGVLTFSASHQYLDNPPGQPHGSFTVTATVTDKDGDSGVGSTSVTVNNVAPVVDPITGPDPSPGVRGETLSFSSRFTDPGTLDTHTVTWNFGDGTGNVDESGAVPGAPFTISHVFTASGTYTVTLSVMDNDGAVTVVNKQVTVVAIVLQPDFFNPSQMDLVAGGTTGNDIILFTPGLRAGDFIVTILSRSSAGAEVDVGYYSPTATGSQLVVQVNGVTVNLFTAPLAAAPARLIAYGQAGDDYIQVASSLTTPAELHGGSGNDILIGGGGNNILLGEGGDDILISGLGRNILIGGGGSDLLISGPGDDILIGGTTVYDTDDVALWSIMAEWSSARDYNTRVANLRGQGSGPRANGNHFLTVSGPNSTVLDDGSPDILTGSRGMDWFFVFAGDTVTGRHRGEQVN